MLQHYVPSILEDMDHYDITRNCWMCAHFQQWNSAQDRCDSPEMKQAVMDLTGVNFVNLILPVEQKTDAGLCAEFLLSTNPLVLEEIADMLEDARIQAQRHMQHYNHLRRCAHA